MFWTPSHATYTAFHQHFLWKWGYICVLCVQLIMRTWSHANSVQCGDPPQQRKHETSVDLTSLPKCWWNAVYVFVTASIGREGVNKKSFNLSFPMSKVLQLFSSRLGTWNLLSQSSGGSRKGCGGCGGTAPCKIDRNLAKLAPFVPILASMPP